MDNDYELVYFAKENDDDAIKNLITKYGNLLVSKARKYSFYTSRFGIDYDDLLQEELIIFYNSVMNFNQNNNSCFNTFINICIERKLSSLLVSVQRNLFYKEVISIELEDVNLLDVYMDNSYNPDDIILNNEKYNLLYKTIKDNLSNYENIIFELKINNLSTLEISDLMDKNIKDIYNVLDRIKIKTKRIISNNYHIN